MNQNRESGFSRRGFLQGVGASTLAAAALGAAKPAARRKEPDKPGLPAKDRLRLGSVAWNFGRIGDDPPWTEAIETIGDLGFAGIELIVAKPEQLDTTVAKQTLATLLRQLDSYKLVVSQFVLYQSVMADLGSPDPEKRKKTLGLFEKGCQVAAKLGAPIINMVAPWPSGYSKKGYSYLPRYYSTGTTMPDKYSFDVPKGFDWQRAWGEFVAVMKDCTAAAKAAGLRFSLENHTHTFVQGPDAFLRLWDEIRDPTLGFNIDIGWIQLQREYPVVAIYKSRGHLMNVHLRDIDGFAYRFVAPGGGCMDFEGVVAALRDIGFSGFLTFEQDGVPDMKFALRHGRELLEEILAKTAA